MEELLKHINTIINLSPEAESCLLTLGKETTYSKDDVLIREGQPVTKVYFVLDGCLRSYCTDKDGKEHTLQFAIKDWWISDYIAIHNNEVATLTVECLSDSKVLEFSAKELNEILYRFPEYEPFQRFLLERHVVSLHKRILNQLQLSAAERYDEFLEQYADIEKYTRNYHIASYLGITQQSLSRIRIERVKV